MTVFKLNIVPKTFGALAISPAVHSKKPNYITLSDSKLVGDQL